ncbi:MAG: hypothetical protein Q9173_006668, partial [Seirophora scorigena]
QYLPSSSSSSTRTTTKTRSSKARIIRQLSLGSVLGVAAGVAVSTFSRALGLLLGLGVVIVQRYVKGINLQSVVEENPALKLSFGLTFALASMARL